MEKMKLKINRFKELVGKEVILPRAIVSGKNGSGKTTILEAFYFVVDGKRADGSNVGGEIYSQFARSRSELFVEVTLEIDEIKFCRRCEGSEKREKGSTTTELVRNINTTLFIERDGKRDVVTQKEWNELIGVYFPENWRYFTNPLFLSYQKQSDVKDFVFDLLQLREFDTKNKDVIKSKVAEKKTEISKLEILMQEYEKVQAPGEVEDLSQFYNKKIEELRSKINVPILSTEDLRYNSEIQRKIEELQASKPELRSLIDEEKLPILVTKTLIPLHDTSELAREIENIRARKYDDYSELEAIEAAERNNEKKSKIEEKIRNYDAIKSGLSCNVCPICSDLFCESRRVDIESFEELQGLNENLKYIDVDKLRTKLELARVEFENEKNNRIAQLRVELERLEFENEKIKNQNAEIKAENLKLTMLHNERVAEITARNEQIRIENEKIKEENARIKQDFENKKSVKLAKLRSLIKYPESVDNSGIEKEIEKIKAEREISKQQFLQYVEFKAVWDNAQKELIRLNGEKNTLLAALVDCEQEYLIEKQREFEHYQSIENQINAELSEFGIKFKLYRKLISSDDFKPDFSIILNNREFNSNGEAFVQRINLCEFFQSKKGIVLPIFCDETAVLDDVNTEKLLKIFETQKNLVILEKSTKPLTIINF